MIKDFQQSDEWEKFPKMDFPGDLLKYNQPERSKREDDKQANNFICGNCHSYKLSANVCRCGALNSMET